MTPAHQLTDVTRARLHTIAARAQRDRRTPGLAAGVAHRGALLWEAGIGAADLADPAVPLGADTQFPIASNTKTFTAALIMALRDEGRLSIDDTVGDHLPERGHAAVTIRQLLSHGSGIQRERPGDFWETLEPVDTAQLLADWDAAEQVLAPHAHWHYSNLAYGLLGEIVARLDGRPWAESLRARLLEPLELRRTTLTITPPHSGQYYVPPFSDVPVTEPLLGDDAFGPAGGLFSTVSDLAAWHAFLLSGDDAILRPDTVAEMREPQMVADPGWQEGYGLGVYLQRRDRRIWFGHTGGLPGAITAVFTDAESGITGIALTNNTATRDPAAIALDLGAHVVDHDPPTRPPWTPGTEVPDALAPLLGVWFSEGNPFVFTVRQGVLHARGGFAESDAPPSVFRAIGTDEYRTVSGDERGERLVVQRADDGSVRQLNWATYRFTRAPLGFGQSPPD